MPTPGEYKTFQARILELAAAIGWTVVSREKWVGNSALGKPASAIDKRITTR